MIGVDDEQPNAVVLAQLAAWQAEIDRVDEFATRVASADALYERRRRSGTFADVRATLSSMSGSAERCWFCEDSQAGEIEHFWPKARYPGRTFDWHNLLFACGVCNRSKQSRFAVILDGGLTWIPKVGEAPSGPPGPLDPRLDDPPALLWLDLRDSFCLAARSECDALTRARVEATIELLDLNRDPLCEQRHHALDGFRQALREYVAWRDRGESSARLSGFRARVLRRAHVSVWREIQRQFRADPTTLEADFAELFAALPEALDW